MAATLPSTHTSPIVAVGLVEMAEALGLPSAPYAALRDAIRDGASAWIPAELEDEFWVAASDDPAFRDFSVVAPATAPMGAFGAVELATTTARDVREGLSTLAVTSDVLHGVPIFDLAEREDGSASLVYRSPHLRSHRSGAMAAELALSSVVEVVRRATGEAHAAPHAALFMGRPHARPSALARALGCSVHTGAALDRLELPPEVLALPLRTHDPRAHRLAMRLVALERAMAHPIGTSVRARHALRTLVHDHGAPLERLAESLGVTARGLQSRLMRERARLRALVDDARRAAADRLLLSGARPIEIQRSLGYADLASLRRASRRWWGMSALARREGLRGSLDPRTERAREASEVSSSRTGSKR